MKEEFMNERMKGYYKSLFENGNFDLNKVSNEIDNIKEEHSLLNDKMKVAKLFNIFNYDKIKIVKKSTKAQGFKTYEHFEYFQVHGCWVEHFLDESTQEMIPIERNMVIGYLNENGDFVSYLNIQKDRVNKKYVGVFTKNYIDDYLNEIFKNLKNIVTN